MNEKLGGKAVNVNFPHCNNDLVASKIHPKHDKFMGLPATESAEITPDDTM